MRRTCCFFRLSTKSGLLRYAFVSSATCLKLDPHSAVRAQSHGCTAGRLGGRRGGGVQASELVDAPLYGVLDRIGEVLERAHLRPLSHARACEHARASQRPSEHERAHRDGLLGRIARAPVRLGDVRQHHLPRTRPSREYSTVCLVPAPPRCDGSAPCALTRNLPCCVCA
jgi:hypothetical protein